MLKKHVHGWKKQWAPVALDPVFPAWIGDVQKIARNDSPIDFLHRHDCLEIGYWHDGGGIFVVEGNVMRFRAGDVAVTAPGVFHYSQSDKGTISHGTWIYIDPVRLLASGWTELERSAVALGKPGFLNVVSGHKFPRIAELVRAIIQELSGKETGYRSSIKGLLAVLLVQLSRLVPAETQKQAVAQENRHIVLDRLAPALDILAGRRSNAINLSDLAEACGLGQTNFRQLFKKTFSRTPQEYLTQIRIHTSAGLLEYTDRKVLDIACECGFPSVSSFNRHFKRIMGVAPREYRKQSDISR